MPSNKPQIKAVVNNTVYEKIKIIAENENRSISNLIETLAIEKIKDYEKQNGSINIQKNINIEDNHGTINM